MKKFFIGMKTNVLSVGELLSYLWARKLWWLIPLVIILVFMGLVMIFASTSGLGPFIYTLF